MAQCARLMSWRSGTSVLDLGGTPHIWENVTQPLVVTILNLPGGDAKGTRSTHEIRFVEGDACSVTGFEAESFDTVFSNSVIEHVGPRHRQEAFAREVRRLGRSYWVQTPSKWFPVEAHCGMPFWWFYPEGVRRMLLRRWRRKLPRWTTMVEQTRVLDEADLRALFPDAQILVERVLGIPKSYIAFNAGVRTASRESNPAESRS